MGALRFAVKGFNSAVHTQYNFRVQLVIAFLVIAAGIFFNVSPGEWIIITLCTGAVLVTELLNTAIELLTDLVMPEFNSTAGKIKDIAAAAVLITAIVSVVSGMIIFIPYIAHMIF